MKHPKVTIVFQPAGGTPADAQNAANQGVFIDLTPGTMTAAQTNAQGVLVSSAPGNKQIELDDSRSYQVVVSATKGGPAPTAASGTKLTVSSGKIVLQPHIAIKITGITASLACSLTIGAKTTNVTSTASGWVTANDQSTGVVTLSSATKLLKVKGAADPAVTLTKPTTITRGDTVKFTVNPPTGAVDFKVTSWSYVASHTNPGSTTSVTATIKRLATETAATFHQFWEGVMCASGSLNVHFVTGVSLRTAGATAVAAEVAASDPLTHAADISVENRDWKTKLVEKTEESVVKPINSAKDTGQHKWGLSDRLVTAKTLLSGPNKGASFAESSTLTFTSGPGINSLLTNASSAFSLAQGEAYLTSPVRTNKRIPSGFYSVGAGGAITITDMPGFQAHFSIPPGGSFSFTALCVPQPDLLAGTRRHEFDHPQQKSHKGNCLKALRALEPRVFLEAQVGLPGGATVNHTTLFTNRSKAVLDVGPTHKIVDEAATKTAGTVQFVTGDSIPMINADANGAIQGSIWNPATNSELP
jgi:hypothetical protein